MMMTKSILAFSLMLAMAACFLVAGPAAAEEAPIPGDRIYIETTPTSNFAGTVKGTEVFYITSNGVPRTIFVAENLEAKFKEPVAVYLNESVLFNLYAKGVVRSGKNCLYEGR